jgi:phage major head subunit gpT-like protein
MILNEQNLALAFKGFKAIYTDAYNQTPVFWDKLAMEVSSGARDESYGWLGQFPQLREWLDGERVVRQLAAHGFTIVNRKFESTVEISRDDFSDDRYGVFKPMFAEMGHLARQHPDQLIFSLIAGGFTTLCYDGQNFFDTDHPVPNPADPEGGAPVSKSNFEAGAGPAWFLFDTSRTVKPFIWQVRERYEFEQLTDPKNYRVFMTDNYLYGVRARVNAGYGLWQLAFASKQALNSDTYAAARRQMMTIRGDRGRLLGVNPNVMVVPAALEVEARKVLTTQNNDNGASNPWQSTAQLIVCPYLDV